jgi:hypothetical protein
MTFSMKPEGRRQRSLVDPELPFVRDRSREARLRDKVWLCGYSGKFIFRRNAL